MYVYLSVVVLIAHLLVVLLAVVPDTLYVILPNGIGAVNKSPQVVLVHLQEHDDFKHVRGHSSSSIRQDGASFRMLWSLGIVLSSSLTCVNHLVLGSSLTCMNPFSGRSSLVPWHREGCPSLVP
jgi:hypothetical protein